MSKKIDIAHQTLLSSRKAAKLSVKVGDKVKVISGDSRGSIGFVKIVIKKSTSVVIDGVNLVKKAVRPSDNSSGSSQNFINIEKPIHISNVQLV